MIGKFNDKVVARDSLVLDSKLSATENLKLWRDKWMKTLLDRKPLTIKSYNEALETFFIFCEKYLDEVTNIGPLFLNHYLIEYQYELGVKAFEDNKIEKKDLKLLKEQKESEHLGEYDKNFIVLKQFIRSLNHRRTTLKSFLLYVTQNNNEQHDFMKAFEHVKTIKRAQSDGQHLVYSELQEVIVFMKKWPDIYMGYKPRSSLNYAYRDSLMILLYALTGIRSEEAVYVKLKHITEQKAPDGKMVYVIYVERAKGDKPRYVVVLKKDIKKHIEYLQKKLPDENYYISSTINKSGYTNKPMHPNDIRKFGNYVLGVKGIHKSGMHTFRRGYATSKKIIDKVDVTTIAAELGNTPGVLYDHYFKNMVEDIMEHK